MDGAWSKPRFLNNPRDGNSTELCIWAEFSGIPVNVGVKKEKLISAFPDREIFLAPAFPRLPREWAGPRGFQSSRNVWIIPSTGWECWDVLDLADPCSEYSRIHLSFQGNTSGE